MNCQAPCRGRPGVPVLRGGDAQGGGVGDRLVQEIDQRLLDAGVLDAGGREKKFHDASRFECHGFVEPQTCDRREATRLLNQVKLCERGLALAVRPTPPPPAERASPGDRAGFDDSRLANLSSTPLRCLRVFGPLYLSGFDRGSSS